MIDPKTYHLDDREKGNDTLHWDKWRDTPGPTRELSAGEIVSRVVKTPGCDCGVERGFTTDVGGLHIFDRTLHLPLLTGMSQRTESQAWYKSICASKPIFRTFFFVTHMPMHVGFW